MDAYVDTRQPVCLASFFLSPPTSLSLSFDFDLITNNDGRARQERNTLNVSYERRQWVTQRLIPTDVSTDEGEVHPVPSPLPSDRGFNLSSIFIGTGGSNVESFEATAITVAECIANKLTNILLVHRYMDG